MRRESDERMGTGREGGREDSGAWNPVISATKRAVHLAGAEMARFRAVVRVEGY